MAEGGKRHYWRKKHFNQRPEISESQTKVRIRSSALGRMCQGGKEGAEPGHQHTVTMTTHDGPRSRDSCFLPIALSLILCVNNTWRQKLWSLVWSSFSDNNEHSHPAQLVIQKFVSIMRKKQRKEMRIETADSVTPKLNFPGVNYFISGLPSCWANGSLGLCLPCPARESSYRRRNEPRCPWVLPPSLSNRPEWTKISSLFCFGLPLTLQALSSMLTMKSESPWVLTNAACLSAGPRGNKLWIHPWACPLVTPFLLPVLLLPHTSPTESCEAHSPLSRWRVLQWIPAALLFVT